LFSAGGLDSTWENCGPPLLPAKTTITLSTRAPYGIVRHPIYTGLILAATAVAILKGNLYSLAGTLLIILGFWIKARLEEQFLSQQLGPETYALYRRRVPMLIPFLPS
jgi:protein-S-isoprenylcysteine O-methyltransferase Ste14